VAMEVHWNRTAIRISSQRFKRHHGVGAFPKGQCRTLRPHDSWKAPDDIIALEVSWSGFGGPLEQRSDWESVLAFQVATWRRHLTKGSGSHIATTRQLEGAGPISGQGGFGQRHRRSTGVDKTLGKRYSFARGKMESEPRHWVTVAHCDHKTLGRRQTPFLTGWLWKASLEVHWNSQAIWKAFEQFKRQDGVGAAPKGQRRTLRPYDSWKAPTPFWTERLWKAAFSIH
jgi:hypothetical protein